MSQTISKTTFTFVVLHPTDQPPMSLEHAMEESMTGNMVGLETEAITLEVPDSEVETELVALGNDGEFFNIELGRTED